MKTSPVRTRLLLVAIGATLLALHAACGASIGDACSSSIDCSPSGDRVCDSSSPHGYCTVESCDFGTCPSDSECVRFFPVLNLAKTCDHTAAKTGCSADELCTLSNKCALVTLEQRFCMKTCGSNGDCRSDEYECRDTTRMAAHGGQPVPDPNATMSTNPQAFCAPRKPCSTAADCDLGDTCPGASTFCQTP